MFNERKHTYSAVIDGEEPVPVPSVTRILSVLGKGDALVQWSANTAVSFFTANLVPEKAYSAEELDSIASAAKSAFKTEKQTALDIGTEAHNWIEGYLSCLAADKNYKPDWWPQRPEAENCCRAAVEWLTEKQVEPVHVERRLFSRQYVYAGTSDLICRINGSLALVDWKSSKALYPEYFLQLAAYKRAYEEETKEKIKQVWLVRLGKLDGEFEARKLTNKEAEFSAFKAALKIHRWQQGLK